MKKATSTTLTGTLHQLLFSPKGKLEGLLLVDRGQQLQVTTEPDALDAATMQNSIGERLTIEAKSDHSPKTKHAVHPVYILKKLHKIGAKTPPTPLHSGSHASIKGVVNAIHYARHGQPNGVILENGEFIHLRPHGMEQCGLKIGSRVAVKGERRTTVLGNLLVEAYRVNRHTIE